MGAEGETVEPERTNRESSDGATVCIEPRGGPE